MLKNIEKNLFHTNLFMQDDADNIALKKGFTFIELIIVVAIISIIGTVVFVALDPLTRFKDSRDAKRWADINAMLSAIKIDQVDNGGSYMSSVANMKENEVYMIVDGAPAAGFSCVTANPSCDTSVDSETAVGDHCVNLAELVTGGYLGSVPVSPKGGTFNWGGTTTGYTIQRSSKGILTIRACESENTTEIKSAR